MARVTSSPSSSQAKVEHDEVGPAGAQRVERGLPSRA